MGKGLGKGLNNWFRKQWGKVGAIACACLLVLGTLTSPLVPAAIAQEVSADFEAKVLKVIDDNPEAILKSVGKYNRIQAERRAQAQSQLRLSLRTNPETVVAGSPVKGNTDAPIVLIEFSDFQCPFCAQAQGEIQRFMSRYGNRVQFVYKHLPLTNIHAQAAPAAAASWAAQQQDKFWPYHDDLYKNQNRLGEELYLELANKYELDIDKFNSDRASEAAISAIQKDVDLADSLSVQGTPTFLMDGVILDQAPSAENLTAAYQAASQQR
ncbi:MAG: thioredoxin domain-containing protein [Cyanobacteria bacterium P01_D01_bin.73]